jgi:hypothetical protein
MTAALIGESSGMPHSAGCDSNFIRPNTGGTHGGADTVCDIIFHLAGLAVDRGQTGIAAAIPDSPDEHSGAVAPIVPSTTRGTTRAVGGHARADRQPGRLVLDRAGRGDSPDAAANRRAVAAHHDLGRGPHRIPRSSPREPLAPILSLRRLSAAGAAAHRAIRVILAALGRIGRIRHLRCRYRIRGGAIRLLRERRARPLRPPARTAGGGGSAPAGRAA